MDIVNSVYTVTFNDLFQNTPLNWACSDDGSPCTNPGPTPPPGNVSVDPLLEGAGSNAARYCPRSNSPALDAGPLAPPSDPVDFFGRPRVQDGDFDGTAIVDLGYCETDEISTLLVHGSGLITWDPSVNGSALYNLYRGDLNVFLTSCAVDCVYTQNLGVVTEARRFCDVASPSFMDTDAPVFAEGYFYLVTGEDIVEGRLGWTGSILHDNDNPCP